MNDDNPPPARRSTTRVHVSAPAPSRQGRARERMVQRQQDRMLPKIDWTWAILGVAVVGVVGVIVVVMLSALGAGSAQQPTLPVVALGTGQNATPKSALAVATVPVLPPNVKAWPDKERMTILLIGLDKRPGEVGRGFRADTLILLSLDPETRKIGMLSIPRDVYLPIPNQPDMQPINSVYVLGELRRPGDGPRLTAETLSYNFGMPIDHFVVVSFETVIKLVDAIGGVDIDVAQAIDDMEYPDMNYGYEPLHISAGLQHMDGQLALKYARTRHQSEDFDRVKRQQQIILAIRQKALRPEVLAQLPAQAPALWDEISRGVITDLAFDQILSLAWFAKDIPAGNIQRGSVENKYLIARQLNGKTIVTLDRALIQELFTAVFGPTYNR